MYEDDKIQYNEGEDEEADEVGELHSDGEKKKKKDAKKSFIVSYISLTLILEHENIRFQFNSG